MELRYLTYNIQHLHLYKDPSWPSTCPERFVEAIRCLQPDVITLNEVRGEGPAEDYTDQVGVLAEKLQMYAFFAPATVISYHGVEYGPYGNAILSRYPLENCEIVPIPDPADRADGKGFETRAVGKADIRIRDDFRITALFSHFGLQPSEAASAVKTVCETIPKCVYPVVLTGDFNVTPDNPILLPIKERLRDTADLFSDEFLSFPSDVPTMKIDYMFCSPELHPVFAHIPALIVSDHRPYLSVFSV